jgi:hypothetical protein
MREGEPKMRHMGGACPRRPERTARTAAGLANQFEVGEYPERPASPQMVWRTVQRGVHGFSRSDYLPVERRESLVEATIGIEPVDQSNRSTEPNLRLWMLLVPLPALPVRTRL